MFPATDADTERIIPIWACRYLRTISGICGPDRTDIGAVRVLRAAEDRDPVASAALAAAATEEAASEEAAVQVVLAALAVSAAAVIPEADSEEAALAAAAEAGAEPE